MNKKVNIDYVHARQMLRTKDKILNVNDRAFPSTTHAARITNPLLYFADNKQQATTNVASRMLVHASSTETTWKRFLATLINDERVFKGRCTITLKEACVKDTSSRGKSS